MLTEVDAVEGGGQAGSVAGRRSAWYARLFQAALALVLLAALVGKATLSRLGDYVPLVGSLEIRALAITLAMGLMLVAVAGNRPERLGSKILGALGIALPWIVLAAYHWWASANLWAIPDSAAKQSDLVYFAAVVLMATLAARRSGDLVIAALVMEGFALALLLASALALGPKTYAYNYGEIGTTITNYRIFGVGLCSALFMLMRPGPIWARVAHLVLACMFVYACLGSTSRTSVAALIAVAGTLLITHSVAGRWKQLAVFGMIVVVGVSAFFAGGSSGGLTGRLAVLSSDGGVMEIPALGSLETHSASEAASAMANVTNALGCDPSIALELGPNVTIRSDSCQGALVFGDPTQRIRMALNAIELFLAHPLWGAGSGAYQLFIGDPSSQPSVYEYPHNVYLETASSSGLVGLAMLGLALLVAIVISARSIALSYENIYLACIPVLYLTGSLTGGDIYDARMAWVVTAVFAGAYGSQLLRQRRAVPVVARAGVI